MTKEPKAIKIERVSNGFVLVHEDERLRIVSVISVAETTEAVLKLIDAWASSFEPSAEVVPHD